MSVVDLPGKGIKSSYRAVRDALTGSTDTGDKLPCSLCGAPTKRETLSDLGARCFPCYQSYCREQHEYPDVGNKHARGPRDWAYALKRRHEAGERLTPVQISSYRSVLRHEPSPADEWNGA
jgi:hypothetical protein